MKYCSRIQEKVGYKYSDNLEEQRISMGKVLLKNGFFAETFPVYDVDNKKILITKLPDGIGELSESFSFGFENTGIMKNGIVYSIKTTPKYDGTQITLGDIMETGM